ncbi:MAG: sensor histidine kinase [Dethiobacteria bacterium]|jgi:signal transduction histidine kinase
MKPLEFVKDKIVYVISHLTVIALTVLILYSFIPKEGISLAVITGILYFVGASIPLIYEYQQKRDFYNNLLINFDRLDRKNLIAEVSELPSFKEGIILYDLLKGSNKAYLEEINRYKIIQEEYREYIELWVHEVKTPIASSKLIAQNNRNHVTDSILEELDKIESFVEQALFYSRSNTVEKDYLVKEISLQDLCYAVFRKNSKLFIQNKVAAETNNLNFTVFCDAKWLDFILDQLVINAIKYRKKENGKIKMSAVQQENSIVLSVIDNGIGIAENELPRIFNKGFVGTNGRKTEKSTGMGLYICKKLCDKLGLSISAASTRGCGTTISLIFPKGSMTDHVR